MAKQKDYSKLEGKGVIYISPSGFYRCEGKVVGCDPEIGITIVNANDPDHYLFCVKGPASPLWQHRKPGWNKGPAV